MKSRLRVWVMVLLAGVLAGAQQQPAATQKPAGRDLNSVLAQMNANAAKFKSAEAGFDLETYESVVQEKTVQKGRIYFRRSGKGEVQAAFDITSPAPKQVVFKDGKIYMYEPNIDQVTVRDVSQSKAAVESFLSLGFGAKGDDLRKDYDVSLAGWEMVDGVSTAKLELVPHNERLRQTYSKIILWIDPEQDVLLQQQFLESSGNYRLTRYTRLKLNGKIPDDAFRLKTTGKTKTVQSGKVIEESLKAVV
jgi:outer membrane lipoprotein-sorting protein